MEEKDRKTLRNNREALLKDLEAKRVASLLYSREIFSEDDKDTVNAKTTPFEQRETVLDTLPRKGQKAFRVFCDILHEVSPHLEQLLRPVQEDGKPDEGTDGPGSKAPIPVSGGPSEQNDQVDHPLRHGGYNVKPLSQGQFDPNTMYRMNRSPRGIAVIINNKNFLESSGQHMAQRRGTDVDRDALKKLFKNLQFKVEVHNNITKAEIRRIAMEKATLDHSIYDAFIFTILTHGEEGLLYGTDGTISIKDITSRFKNNKTLAGKPKIFFFQACQGQEFMDGMDVPDGPPKLEKVSVPVEADFIYAYSTVPGYYSWRNNTDGSWFIQSVVEVFKANAHHMDILQMLTRVNDKLSYFKSRNPVAKNKMQVGCTVSMLTKDLYFFQDKGKEQNYNGDIQDSGGSECKML